MMLATPMSYYSCVFVLLLLISKVNNQQIDTSVLCLPATLCYHFSLLLIVNSTQLKSARLG